MTKWTTNLECGGQHLASVNIQRGIFQGDSLSSLLFIICLIPLSVMLREANQGYNLTRTPSGKINHLLYMDDLKLYGKNKSELESLIQTVRLYTQDIRRRYVKMADKTDIKRTYKWIKNGYMKKETEGLITAAQDQALPTRWRKVKIEKQSGTSLCKMCNERDETTFHQ